MSDNLEERFALMLCQMGTTLGYVTTPPNRFSALFSASFSEKKNTKRKTQNDKKGGKLQTTETLQEK